VITIHKYTFSISDRFEFFLPEGAEILSVQLQRGQPTMWAKVDTEASMETRIFYVLGTGHPFPSTPFKHIASFQQDIFVWHLFEETK